MTRIPGRNSRPHRASHDDGRPRKGDDYLRRIRRMCRLQGRVTAASRDPRSS
jgi:hypothetical protein